MLIDGKSKLPIVLLMTVSVLTMVVPALAETISFQQGVNGYDRGQDTSIRWAYGVNFGDTADIDSPHQGDSGAYELRNTNSGGSAILEVGNFYHRVLGGIGSSLSTPEAGPTYRYSKMMIRFRDVFGTGAGQVSPDTPIAKATLKLYNTFDLGAEASAGAAFLGDTVAGPGGVIYDNPHAAPKMNAGRIAAYPLLSAIKYGKSDGPAVKGETTAEWRKRAKERWAAIFEWGMLSHSNDPVYMAKLGPRDVGDPAVGHFSETGEEIAPGVTADYDSGHPGVVEVFQDATEGFKAFDVTGLMEFITGEGVLLMVELPDESALPTMEQNFGNAYHSNEFGGANASAEDIATRPILVIEFVPEPGTVALVSFGGLLLLRRCRI